MNFCRYILSHIVKTPPSTIFPFSPAVVTDSQTLSGQPSIFGLYDHLRQELFTTDSFLCICLKMGIAWGDNSPLGVSPDGYCMLLSRKWWLTSGLEGTNAKHSTVVTQPQSSLAHPLRLGHTTSGISLWPGLTHNPQIFPVDPKPAQYSAPVSSAPTSWATRGEEYSMTLLVFSENKAPQKLMANHMHSKAAMFR